MIFDTNNIFCICSENPADVPFDVVYIINWT